MVYTSARIEIGKFNNMIFSPNQRVCEGVDKSVRGREEIVSRAMLNKLQDRWRVCNR